MKSWICTQIGARRHFAIPRTLHRCQRLDRLITDFWAKGAWQHCRHLGASGKKLAGRWHPQLGDAHVKGFQLAGMNWILQHRRRDSNETFVDQGRWFATAARDELQKIGGFDATHMFFSFDMGFLETAEWLKERGVRCIVGQVDPDRVERRIVTEEAAAWPGWAPAGLPKPPEFHKRREAEWDVADVVVVNSEWSREALIELGVPREKIRVIALCYEPADIPPSAPQKPDEALQVLWLGSVLLRKGIQYLFEAARKLEGKRIQFNIVGPIGISRTAVESAPANVKILGPAPRTEATRHYSAADIFVLPTLSDGFALTQLEAMAHGLPVIATANCGRVVTDGVDGRIVPIRDPQALADAIEAYADDRQSLAEMSSNAREKSQQFGMNRLEEALIGLESIEHSDDARAETSSPD